MAQFCGDIKCEFYDDFPDGNKFPFCPYCRKRLVAKKPSLPEVTDPQPVDQPTEREKSFVDIDSHPNVVSNQLIAPIYNWGVSRRRKITSRQSEDAIVTFSTAVLKKHYLQSKGCISLRFKSSSIGEFKFERIEFKGSTQVNYEGNEFVLLEETIKINMSVLAGVKHCEQLLIPYKYCFSDCEEKLYLKEGDCYRNLIIDWFTFTDLKNIRKFDMIVLPEELVNEEYYLKQIDTRLSIIFNMYVPGEKRLLHLPISNIKDEVQTILFSLCNGYYSKLSRKEKKNFQVYDSTEQINMASYYILNIWLKGLMNTSLPFHSKFLILFYSFEDELIQPHSTELFILLFRGVNSGFIISLINSRCDAFSDYISEIKSRPYLLRHAMQGISSKDFSQLVKFLPLYHFLFDSKEYFNIAQSNNAFLDNAYWGLPSDVKFQYYDDVDISVIRDAMSMFHTIDPLLPYSIILLTLRSDIFPNLLETLSIPFLSFFSVLLYRVKTWSLIQQDCELRELVFTTFLKESEQTPDLMNEDDICQACDVIFRMLDVIKDSQVTPLGKLNLKQVKCILHVLAKLLGLFDENNPTFLSLQHFHLAKSIIISLKTAPVLLTTIRSCLYEDVLRPNYQSKCTLFEEVTNVWNVLCCLPFPQEYNWNSEVCKQLSKRSQQTLESILTTFVEICNRYNELQTNISIISSFLNEILETLRRSEIVDKDQRTAIEHIVHVSKERFYLVADIITAILVSNSSKLNENPVKQILTLPWWSRVVKFCEPNEFTQSHPDAEKIMELVRNTFSNISLEYLSLEIKTKDLTLILDNQNNYFSMLQSMPGRDNHILKQLDTVFFNDSIQHRRMLRDAFEEFHARMQDLKKLLDSTNTQIRSQELSQFLDFDFENSSISTLSRISEDGKISIMPNWEHSEILNNSMFNLMLRTLQYILKSQYFLSTYKRKVEELQEFEKSLKELHLLFTGAIDTIRNTIRVLFNMKILISTVYIHFYNDTAALDSDLFDREIDHLVSAIEILYQQPCYNKVNKAESVRRVKLCFKLKQRQKLTETIIQVKNQFRLKGNFCEIDILKTLNNQEMELQSITEEMFNISNQIFQFNDLDQQILDSLLICVDLFLWASSILQTQTDLENLRELALNSIDGSPFEINRISSFYTLCRLFSPFIYELNKEIDQESFLNRLSKVHHNIKSREDVRSKLLEICRDCAREANIEFWKTLELKHTSIGGNTLSHVKLIMSDGKFILNIKKSSCSVEDVISLQISQNCKIKTFSLNELKEMQSETVLISPEMHQDSVSARFQHLLKLILSLSEILLKFHKSGNVVFRNKKLAYSCYSTDIMSEDISFLEGKYKNWINNFEEARQKCYYLNFFTSSQILTIQIELERLGRFPSKVIEKQAFYLLTFLSEDLSEKEVCDAFNTIKRGSFSSDYSPISSVDSVITSDETDLSTRVELPSFETSFIDMSIPSPTINNQLDIQPYRDLDSIEIEDELDETHTFHVSKSETIKMYKNQHEYISLTKLEEFFRILTLKMGPQKRNFFLTSGEPNLIFVASHLIMDSILSLYYPSKQLPYPHEVLICSKMTTLEEIEIFWRRSLHNASNAFIFCLASIEKLNYDIAAQSVSSLKDFLYSVSSNKSEFRLVLICSEEHKHSSYMASALVRYERILTKMQSIEDLKSYVFKSISASADFPSKKSEHFPIKPASTVDLNRSYARIVLSESHGNGKSLWITRLVEDLTKLRSKSEDPHLTPFTIVSLYESKGCEDKAVDKLLASPVSAGEYGRIYHFDIICPSDKHLLSFLFKLLIMRTICDSSGRIYRCSKNNYYVIEANLSTLNPELMHFFDLFPVWKCLGPNEVLGFEKKQKHSKMRQITLHDTGEFESDAFQRVFKYLAKLESRANIDEYVYTNDPDQNCGDQLDLLLKYYDLDNPSWSEIKHFISFFNEQLIACEENIYCQSVEWNKDWSGFKQFLVDCMVLMSKDFTTPSLRNSLQSPPPDAVAGYGIDENRKWGQKNYPNIFINKDHQSMTFFGMSISQNLNKLDGFDSNRVIAKKVIPKQLYNLLKKNEVNLEEDFHNWDRHKMLSILVNVMGVPSNSSVAPPDPDPNYVLTVDNVKKILAIHMRFRSSIPVILMGDTGCGKTRLIQFMSKLQARNPDLHNLVILKVHGEITENDIKDSYRNALEIAERNSLNNIDTILFFDEANTSYSIGLIKEMLCDRRVDGVPIPNRLRLQFVVACNPYQRHSEEMLAKLTSAGLGMLASNDQVREHFIDIPLRELVYRVLPLPNSLLPLVWDFGNLDPESEKSYIYNIVDANLKHDTYKQLVSYSRVISETLYHSQMYMRKRRDECSFVSLRDVERTARVMMWFYQWLPNLQIPNMTLDLITYSLILALAVCYRAKLRERKEFDEYVISNVDHLRNRITETSLITREVEKFQDVVVSMMSIGEHIARNRALKENLFMMFVCIQLKIPLFIIGKPGTSKSLAKYIISHSMNGDLTIHGKKVAGIQFTQCFMQSYQCSQLTTSEEIRSLFWKCEAIQAQNDRSCVACVVLDEVGLAEDSPNLPLKILHSLLEDGMDSEGQGPGVAFIGLSNWALDPAKMNRGIMLHLEDPTAEELVNTAHSIIKPCGERHDSYSQTLSPYIKSLAEGYLKLVELPLLKNVHSKDYFGLRDFYHLIKMLYFLCKKYNILNKRIITHALKKNFGGITDINVIGIFTQYLNIPDSEDDIGPLSDPLSLITSSLESKSHEDPYLRSRYLLLLTDDCVALDILFNSHILNEDTKVIFGSSFPLDQEYFSICHNLNRIKIFMETGKTVVLTNLSNVYESLYEMLNQFYVELFGRSWVDIGIGSRRIKCAVHPDFRLIVIADKSTVFEKFPPPLINRLEKHILTISTIIQDDVVVTNIVAKLTEWLRRFDAIHINIQNNTLPFMVYSTINKLGLKGREIKWMEHILEVVKFEVLKLVAPSSIIRLSKSDLPQEASEIYENYCKIKLYSLVDYFYELSKNRKRFSEHLRNISLKIGNKSSSNESNSVPRSKFDSKSCEEIPYLSFVTTHSILLTENDISEIANNLTAHFEMKPNISLINLTQFRAEKEFIFSINQDISIKLKENEKKIIIIQCEQNNRNSDLISCAKYRLVEITKVNPNLNSNFYFILIIKLVLTEPGSGCSSFCGEPWDSVYIDELRKSYLYLLPPFDQITQLSVAQIFDFHYQDIPNLTSISSHGDKYYFKNQRLFRCVQKAVFRLFDPSESTNERSAQRISMLSKFLSHQELANLTCDKISNLLSQISSTKYSAEWAYIKALEPDSSTCCINFMKTLSLYIDDLIVPLLGGILAILDTHNNLDLPFHKEEEKIKQLWGMFYRDENIINLSSLVTERSLSSPYSNLNHSRKIKLVKNCFPFFQNIYQQVNRLFHQMCANVGINDTFEKFEENFNQSSIGRAVSTVNDRETKSSLSIQEAYLWDFSKYHMSSVDIQLFRTIYIMLSAAASEHRKMRMADKLPEVTIPSIHIAYHLIRRRIVFVNEAFNLGIRFPQDHVINLENWYQNPKTFSELRYIDFMIFVIAIEKCLEEVQHLKQHTSPKEFKRNVVQYHNFVDTVSNYSSLIEENWNLFENDFSKDMDSLRSKWEGTKCLAIFFTHFFDEKLLEDEISLKLKSTAILQEALNRIYKIVTQEGINFKHLYPVKSTLDALIIFTSVKTEDVIHVCNLKNQSKELSSIFFETCSCQLKLLDFFQDLSSRFFLQMLFNITFSNGPTSIREDLRNFLTEFLIKNQIPKKQGTDTLAPLYLFKDKEINPSPALRCILLEVLLRDRNESTQDQIQESINANYLILERKELTYGDNLASIYLQSLEDSYHHHNLPKNKENIGDVLSKFKTSLCPISSSKTITFEIIESVAAIRFAIHWIVKWKTASHLRRKYLGSQKGGFVSENTSQNHDIPVENKELIVNLGSIASKDPDIQLFLSKTFYFHVGYGEMLKYKEYSYLEYFFAKDYEAITETKKWYLDLFYGIDATYMTVKELIRTGSTKILNRSTQKKMGVKRFQQNIIFAIFSEFVPYHLGSSIREQSSEKEKQSRECIYTILPKEPIDLQTLATDILENNLFNLPQLKISPDTHLNTVFIAGVLCHIGVFLQMTHDNTFFKPLTLIHFNPTELQNHFFPAISEEEYTPTKTKPLTIKHLTDHPKSIKNRIRKTKSCSDVSTSSVRSQTGLEESKMGSYSPPIYSHVLGDPIGRSASLAGIRNLAPISVALIRTLMHSIFIWTLQSKHKEHPSEIIKLVKPISPKNTYLEYFYLHLVQDIIDITTISNNTFEEAILHVHLLIDMIIHQELEPKHDDPLRIPTDLLTPTDRDEWEYFFEKTFTNQLFESSEMLLREKMLVVISKSDNCDISLLKTFYEEEKETNRNSMLWRHRSIIGYEHLSQVFNCQSLHTIAKYPLLEKFLKEKTLLSVTKYLPDLVNLKFQLIQKSMEYCSERRISELSISEFIEFIKKKETTHSADERKQIFANFQIIWSELTNQHKSSLECNTMQIGDLIGVGNNGGLLTILISRLVDIHNGFISQYNKSFCTPSRSKRTVPLSVVSPSHMINYEDHLDSLIFSNATYSFQMGEGTHIHYNFSGIQKDFGTRFMSSKPIITLEALDTEYPEQISMVDYFKRLNLKIPQEELPDWDTIREEVMNPGEISEVISLIEMVLNFASSTDGCSPNTKINFYLHEILRYPEKKNLISKRANEICCLKHLSSLWHHLSIHRAKRLALLHQPPFPSISRNYLEDLRSSDIPRLLKGITKRNVDGILALIHDFIFFHLNLLVSDHAALSNSKLRESLVDFSKVINILVSPKEEPADYEIIPDDLLVSQTMSVWMYLAVHSEKRLPQ